MSFALEIRGVSKRFVVGIAGCTGSVSVLRAADLTLRRGEAVAVAGARGAGKSTLLLCAAGLLRVDSGSVAWFGSPDRSVAADRTLYYFAGGTPRGLKRPNEGMLHVVDGPESLCLASASRTARWIDRRCSEGDAVLLALRSVEVAREIAPRVVVLRDGRVRADGIETSARVAEPTACGTF